jgi:tripartite-type tricarboxylate transporter receptor subunit TctC
VVENVTGAGGMIGSNRVAQATPDGYQFVLGSVGTHAQNQTLYKKPLYNVVADFTPVILMTEQPLVLLARKDLPAGNLQEFIAYAKANQAKMQFGSAGTGTASHLGCVLLNAAIGIDVTSIPYRGTGPALQDLQASRIDYVCTSLSQIPGDTVKAIATLSKSRWHVLPELATAQEQGLTNFEAYTWFAIFLPKNAPPAIVNSLHAAAVATIDTPAVQERLTTLGLSIVGPERRSPDYLADFVKTEIEKWAAPIRASNLSVD